MDSRIKSDGLARAVAGDKTASRCQPCLSVFLAMPFCACLVFVSVSGCAHGNSISYIIEEHVCS